VSAELIERLRSTKGPAPVVRVCFDAADALASKDEEIKRLRILAGLGCDANDGGPHDPLTQGSYRFCSLCGETLAVAALPKPSRETPMSAGDRSGRRFTSYRAQRFSLWHRGQRTCHYCGLRLTLEPGHQNTLTLDHKIPISAGGPNKPFNYAAACGPCNATKGSMSEADFRRVLRQRQPDVSRGGGG